MGGVTWPFKWHKSSSYLSSLKVRSLIEVAGAMGMAGVDTCAHDSQTEYLLLSHGSWCVVLDVGLSCLLNNGKLQALELLSFSYPR